MIITNNNFYEGTSLEMSSFKRGVISRMINEMHNGDYWGITLPIMQAQDVFLGKVDDSIVCTLQDTKIVLTPDYTPVIQNLSKEFFKDDEDVKIYYIQECFRKDLSQKGLYHQFTQFGVEIINPTINYSEDLINFSTTVVERCPSPGSLCLKLLRNVANSINYYKDFTFILEDSATGVTVCNGGSYDGGIGFAINLDKLISLNP